MTKNTKTTRAIRNTGKVELSRGQKAAATKAAKRAAEILAAEQEAARIASLSPAQKAMETKRANGSDLSAIALKAVQTRRDNAAARAELARLAEIESAKAEKAARLSEIAHRAVATRRANQIARNGGTTLAIPAKTGDVTLPRDNAALVNLLKTVLASLA